MTAEKLVWSPDEVDAALFTFRHPLDDATEVRIAGLSRLAGMARSGINLARIAPGRTAFPLHRHHVDEEWVFVLSGTAEIRLDDKRHRLAAGGFATFPPGGPAHSVTNPSASADLVCLMGGSAVAADIVDFPEHGKRLNRVGRTVEVGARDAFAPFDFFARSTPPGGQA